MNKKTIIFSTLLLLSLIMSALALYETWRNQPATQPERVYYDVRMGGGQYRIYVLRDGQTVIADERFSASVFGFWAEGGDEIAIRAYSSSSLFFLELYVLGNGTTIYEHTGETIDFTYTVPR